jgi:hypothetical protein
MVTAIARTIPKTNKSLSGSGFGAMSPPPWRQIDVAVAKAKGRTERESVTAITLWSYRKKL